LRNIYKGFETLEQVYAYYGEENIIDIVNIKQVMFYAKNRIQPVFIYEGYKGKPVYYYLQMDTSKNNAWRKWQEQCKEWNKANGRN
jgi:hypothetical protein